MAGYEFIVLFYENIICCSTPRTLKLHIFIDLDAPYFIGQKGGSCETGYMIMDRNECIAACSHLTLNAGNLRNQKMCYLAGNGKCRADGRYKIGQGTKTSPICKRNGNIDCCSI